MKIFVCIKQVPDTESKIKLKADGSGIDETGIKWVINPYDEFAIEEAVKIKEANGGTPIVTVMSVGPKGRVVDSLRTALAMGADDAVVIDAPYDLDGLSVAQLLAKAIQKEGGGDLVLTGKLAIDGNGSAVAQSLAESLKWPHANVVSKLENKDGGWLTEREVEGGTREITHLKGPAVVGANKGLNTPRYANLPGIMKAKKKPLKEMTPQDLGVTIQSKTKLVRFQLPAEKPPVKMLAGDAKSQAKELAQLLMNEAKVF